MSKLQITSFDWDSTVADTSHRHGMIDRTKENGPDFWNLYSLESYKDGPGPAYTMAKYYTDNDLPWIITSGRSEIARAVGNEWLRRFGLRPWHVYLCDDRHNYMSHGEWKSTRLLEIQRDLDCEIVLHVDDIADVAVWNEKVGIPTMLVHDKNSNIVDHLG